MAVVDGDEDMEDRVKAEIAGALQASREETKAELKAQIAGLMDFLAQGQGNGQNNNGNGAAEMSGLEEKQASAATPARQNLNFIYGAKNTQTPAANASRADSQPSSGNGGNAGGGATGGGTAGGGGKGSVGAGSWGSSSPLLRRLR